MENDDQVGTGGAETLEEARLSSYQIAPSSGKPYVGEDCGLSGGTVAGGGAAVDRKQSK